MTNPFPLLSAFFFFFLEMLWWNWGSVKPVTFQCIHLQAGWRVGSCPVHRQAAEHVAGDSVTEGGWQL